MKLLKWTAPLAVATLLSGCATEFWGSAPAGNGSLYVAGALNSRAALWKCPSENKGKCERVKVNFKD